MKLLDTILDWFEDRKLQKKIALMPRTYQRRLARACDGDDPNRERFRSGIILRVGEEMSKEKKESA